MKIARLFGIDIKIHSSFLLGLALVGLSVYLFGGHHWHDVVEVTAMICVIFACVLLHEFGHALAAAHYGIETVDITLLPFGGLARLERMPEDPWQEMFVAVGGPLVNVAIILGLGFILGPAMLREAFFGRMSGAGPEILMLSYFLLAVNVKLLLFNLIPAFPMDGGRMLRALLGLRLGHTRATQVAVSVGQVFAVLFGLVGLGLLLPERFGPWNPVLVLIAFFVYYAGSQEAGAAQVRDLTRNTRVADILITDFQALGPQTPLREAVQILLHTSQHDFPVCDPESAQVLGVLARQDLIAALSDPGGIDGTVAGAMRADVPTVTPHDTIDEVFRTMQASGSPLLPVVDFGRLVGLVTPDSLGEMMLVRSAVERGSGQPSWRAHRARRRPAPAPLPPADGEPATML